MYLKGKSITVKIHTITIEFMRYSTTLCNGKKIITHNIIKSQSQIGHLKRRANLLAARSVRITI